MQILFQNPLLLVEFSVRIYNFLHFDREIHKKPMFFQRTAFCDVRSSVLHAQKQCLIQ